MTLRVLHITGSSPPDICGVGDYTNTLSTALRSIGVDSQVFCHRDWSLFGTIDAIRQLDDRKTILHLQYPTVGYGHSLGPQLLSLARRNVVTLHEYTLAHPLRKLSLLPFTLRAPRVVMTSDFEMSAAQKSMPWIGSRIRTIPIGSNIPVSFNESRQRSKRLIHFGLIMPGKGIEEFLELSRLIRARGLDWELVIIGKVIPAHAAYATKLMHVSSTLGVQWKMDLDASAVAEELASAALGYFAFKDGASERRGSLKAALSSGLPSITTSALHTPAAMREAVAIADTPSDALNIVTRLMSSPEQRAELSQRALRYSLSFQWDAIARSHLKLYAGLL